MKFDELKRYQDQLTGMRNRLREEIGQMVESAESSSHETGGHDPSATDLFANEMQLGNTELSIRQAVQAALKRIEDGTYGWCQDCGGPIAKARLDALPYAEYCIGCERKNEA